MQYPISYYPEFLSAVKDCASITPMVVFQKKDDTIFIFQRESYLAFEIRGTSGVFNIPANSATNKIAFSDYNEFYSVFNSISSKDSNTEINLEKTEGFSPYIGLVDGSLSVNYNLGVASAIKHGEEYFELKNIVCRFNIPSHILQKIKSIVTVLGMDNKISLGKATIIVNGKTVTLRFNSSVGQNKVEYQFENLEDGGINYETGFHPAVIKSIRSGDYEVLVADREACIFKTTMMFGEVKEVDKETNKVVNTYYKDSATISYITSLTHYEKK